MGSRPVVEDDDIARAHPRREHGGVVGDHTLIDRARSVVERTAVAERAMQAVVDALGDVEELGRAIDDDPARVDPGAARVGDKRAQQLDHATPERGRVHVPDDPPGEQLARLAHAALEVGEPVGRQHRTESLRGRTPRCRCRVAHRVP